MNQYDTCLCGNIKCKVSNCCRKCFLKNWINPQIGKPLNSKQKNAIKKANTKYLGILQKDILIKFYTIDKLSTVKIGKIFSINPTTVGQYLKRYKIKKRTRNQYPSAFKNKHHTAKSKKLLSLKHKGVSSWNKISLKKQKELRKARSIRAMGKKNPMYGRTNKKNPSWKGGLSKFPYSFDWTIDLKNKIRRRDNYQCARCSMTEKKHKALYKRNLHIHHIDYDKLNCKPENLITLCHSCHAKSNYNRDYWFAFYMHYKEINNVK